MILSVSRRTDIPAFYGEWFLRRLEEGFLLVRNPMNPRRVSRLDLSPAVVDGLVFWTKNPVPLIPSLSRLAAYPYYFLYTITPYGREIESGVPPVEASLESFITLSRILGPHRVIWRYDPVFLTPRYDIDTHLAAFASMARRLEGYTHRCVVSFLDYYGNTRKNLPDTQAPDQGERIASSGPWRIWPPPGHYPGGLCRGGGLLPVRGPAQPLHRRRAAGANLREGSKGKKDPGQRPHCGCAESVDVGTYSTCSNGCLYCYAERGAGAVDAKIPIPPPGAPLGAE